MTAFNSEILIAEVRSRPALYSKNVEADREEKLKLWKEIGAAIYPDWNLTSKADTYDRVLELQRKWRSLRDAYNRELRQRASNLRLRRRPYIHFENLKFLSGDTNEEEFNYDLNESTSNLAEHVEPECGGEADDPLVNTNEDKKPKIKRRRTKKNHSQGDADDQSNDATQDDMQIVFPIDNMDNEDNDADRLFLLSFAQEMSKLPVNIRMWARAEIANVMHEAVAWSYNGEAPSGSKRFRGHSSNFGGAGDAGENAMGT